MTLKANQKNVGVQRGKSPPDEVQRAGRDSFFKKGAKGHIEPGKDAGSDADRSKRDSGVAATGGYGIGKGDADKGGRSVSRIPDDISSV